jgi:fatty acid amide hydrolase
MEGEKLISSVQLILTVNGLPQWLRTMAGSFLDLIGEYRQAVTIRAIGAVSVEQEWRLQHQMRELKKQFLKAWQEAGLDVLLSPPNILPALPHGAGSKLGVSCGYSVLYNVLDFPAGVLPVTLVQPDDYQGRPRDIKDALDKIVHSAEQDSETMPVGVQVAALPWREELVLRVMKEIEAAQAHKFDAPKLHRQFRFKEWAKVANHGCLDREDVI